MNVDEAPLVLTVNGAAESRAFGTTLADVVAARLGFADQRRVAASVNGRVVPRVRWESSALSDGDGVAILILVHSG
jgi:thiamine biosynthesis protein ThiS